ncbi:4Fe-4S dicluster domain-containing protein [Candidatus Ozemobacteraceae bacterium]|nr:4Fe-4S dicluster domain-containing protein [Candidatus Ozemobacteraceae bacterium]
MAKLLRVVNREQCIGCYSCMYSCSRTWAKAITVEKSAIRIRNYAGVEGAFSVRPCVGCDIPDCASACPTSALTRRKFGGVQLDASKCINCGACVQACAFKALQWDTEKRQPLVCHHCGVCTQFCPRDVIAMVDTPREA